MRKNTTPLFGAAMTEHLTCQRLRELLSYDPETGDFRWVVDRSPAVRAGSVAGCINKDGYVIVRIDGRGYAAHRLAWLYTYSTWPTCEIDHRNGVRSCNRLENLRECSKPQNHQNRGLSAANTSGYTGVFFNKAEKRWAAKITKDGRKFSLGTYATAEQASVAYQTAKAHLHQFQPHVRGSNLASDEIAKLAGTPVNYFPGATGIRRSAPRTPLLALLRQLTADQRVQLADDAGTSVSYLYSLASCQRTSCSTALALQIERATEKMCQRTGGETAIVTVHELGTMCLVAAE